MNFTHYNDAPIAVAVDLINRFGTRPRAAAGHGDEPLGDPAEFLRDHAMDDAGVTGADAEHVRALADRLHEVFVADNEAAAVAAINGALADAAARPCVTGHDGQDWHVHYETTGGGPLDQLAVTVAMGLAAVLCSGGIERFGRCDGSACRDAYVDTSRNNRRRFCTDGCANRAHVAAHRARRRQEAE